MSRIRQNYHEECEARINKQINMELYASYAYLSMVRFLAYLRFFVMKNLKFFRAFTFPAMISLSPVSPSISRRTQTRNGNMLKNSWSFK